MKTIFRFVVVICLVFLAYTHAIAKSGPPRAGEIKKGIRAAGVCAIAGLNAEQSQLMALQRARAAAIRKATGEKAVSELRTTAFEESMRDIETYARGFIVREKVNPLPPGRSKKGSSAATIPEYRVWIVADVYIPGPLSAPPGLKASLSRNAFRNGDKAEISIRTAKDAGVAVFLMRADDKVSMVFPNIHELNNIIPSGRDFIFPAKGARIDLEMQATAGRQKDLEAFFVIAWDKAANIKAMDLFPDTDPMGFGDFFGKLSTIGGLTEMKVLPYTVTGPQK